VSNRSILCLLVSLLLAFPAHAAPGLLAKLPDGRRINLVCTGKGSPTVILESGWGADAGAWARVRPEIAKDTRVCAYDRAGAGHSDPGPLPRSAGAIAADLDAALRAARIGGPLILVGHSAGGLYVRALADRRPRDVAGMVLVDPTVELQEQQLAARFGKGAGSLGGLMASMRRCLEAVLAGTVTTADAALKRCSFTARPGEPQDEAAARAARMRRPAYWATRLSELENLGTARIARRDYGEMPLIVLTAGHSFPAPAASFWAGLHEEIAARSRKGRVQVVNSGHIIMNERPDAVIAAIRAVIADVR
jgi:pimeloyl-ACP methyl ester carboxylesterase